MPSLTHASMDATASSPLCTSYRWSVTMAQYVPPPSPAALSRASPFFHKYRRTPGTWLYSAEQAATLTIACSAAANHHHTLALTLRGRVHEEHLVRNLAFTRPSVRPAKDGDQPCAAPGRVVFASYIRIATNTKHKVAMQFKTPLQADKFCQVVKHVLADDGNKAESLQSQWTELPPSSLQLSNLEGCSEGIGLRPVGHEFSEESLIQGVRNRIPRLDTELSVCSQESTDALNGSVNSQNKFFVLPPRFPRTELQNHLFEESNSTLKEKEASLPASAEILHSEQRLKEEIMACFLDPEFLEFVDKVERICESMEKELNEMSAFQT